METVTIISIVWLVLSVIAVPFASWGFIEALKDYGAAKTLTLDSPENQRRYETALNGRRRACILMVIQYVDVVIGFSVLFLDPETVLRLLIARAGLMFDKFFLVALIIEQFRWRRIMQKHD